MTSSTKANIHRPSYRGLIYGSELTEINEDGVETVVPQHLICRAKQTPLRDETLVWASEDAATNVKSLLEGVESESEWPQETEIVESLTSWGWSRIGVLHEHRDEGFMDHHLLVRNQLGEHLDVMVTWETFPDDDDLYINRISVDRGDAEGEEMILRLQTEDERAVAHNSGLLCTDDDGDHVQVCAWHSALWLANDDQFRIDKNKLRQMWLDQVRSANP